MRKIPLLVFVLLTFYGLFKVMLFFYPLIFIPGIASSSSGQDPELGGYRAELVTKSGHAIRMAYMKRRSEIIIFEIDGFIVEGVFCRGTTAPGDMTYPSEGLGLRTAVTTKDPWPNIESVTELVVRAPELSGWVRRLPVFPGSGRALCQGPSYGELLWRRPRDERPPRVSLSAVCERIRSECLNAVAPERPKRPAGKYLDY